MQQSVRVVDTARCTYFCVIQFPPAGYCGIQERENGEKIALFSVWDQREGDVQVVKTGTDVVSEPFGGEGTGQKLWRHFAWELGQEVHFVVRVRREGGSDFWQLSGEIYVQKGSSTNIAVEEKTGACRQVDVEPAEPERKRVASSCCLLAAGAVKKMRKQRREGTAARKASSAGTSSSGKETAEADGILMLEDGAGASDAGFDRFVMGTLRVKSSSPAVNAFISFVEDYDRAPNAEGICLSRRAVFGPTPQWRVRNENTRRGGALVPREMRSVVFTKVCAAAEAEGAETRCRGEWTVDGCTLHTGGDKNLFCAGVTDNGAQIYNRGEKAQA
eukprot:g6217.t1